MIIRKELLPGVFLNAVESRKFKTGCFSVNFLRPMCHEEAAQNALIPSVLLRGCREHPDIRAISRHLDELYGASVGTIVRKKGETQIFGLYADHIEDELVKEPIFRRLVGFVHGLLFEPLTENEGFLPDAFFGERENLYNAMDGALNDKRIYAVHRLLAHMCPEEPYGIPSIGVREDLKPVTPASLYRHYRDVLGSSQIELFYMGRTPPDETAEIFSDLFTDLHRGERLQLPRPETKSAGPVRSVEEQLPLSQSKLCIGCRLPVSGTAKELAARLVFNVIYGAGTNCKLFLNVREEKSLCYYANASYDKYKGILLITSGIDAEKYQEAKDEILRQLSDCANGVFSDEDLRLAKLQLITQLKTDLDNPGRLEEYYIGQAVSHSRISIEALIDAIDGVSREDAREAAAEAVPDTIYLLKGVGS